MKCIESERTIEDTRSMAEEDDLAKAIAASLETAKEEGVGVQVGSNANQQQQDQDQTQQDKPDQTETPVQKKELTKEEKQKIIQEKLAEVKNKKAEEEKKLEKERELNRITAGKEMIKQQRLFEDEERQRLLDFRKREKEEQKKAKKAILDEIARDKAERRSRLGLQPEEGKSTEAADAAEKPKSKPSAFYVKPVSTQNKVRELLVSIKQKYPKEKSDLAFRTLSAYIGNVGKHPTESKFRSIRSSNNAFKQRIASLEGGEAVKVLQAVGFEAGDEFYTLGDQAFDKAKVEVAFTELNNALTNPYFGVL